MPNDVTIPESEWQQMQELTDRIKRRSWEQEDDLRNLSNLMHALHGEGVRDQKYTADGTPCVFVDGKWISRG
jgi:hypothetical protein